MMKEEMKMSKVDMHRSPTTHVCTHDGNTNSKEFLNETIKYSVYRSCLLLLSGIQLHFMGEYKKENKKKKITSLNQGELTKEKNHTCERQKMFLHYNFIRDYEMYHMEPKRSSMNDQESCLIPLYKKK
ncbi:hypothetical protein, conserved [Plasmodium gonderi]|uniref:Uncharacterized protein n=1 Tax=Plasmodium gonderi TaxID=77519 RepID=A0A1Y1JF82_PLAGO|nr:hypothetical protein, conserved [Plasmodium gonderi]GAW79995.1 hypothetical protein, conserved [Plasmodium gonderi]